MELGVMTNIYRTYTKSEGIKRSNSYGDQLRQVVEAGYKVADLNTCASVRGVEDDLSRDDWEARIDALGEQAAQSGIRISQAHAPFNGDFYLRGSQPTEEYTEMFREMTRRCIVASGRLGVKWVTVHPLTDTVNTEYDNAIQLETNHRFYAEFVELAAKVGTGIAFENMIEAAVPSDRFRRRYGADVDDLIGILDSFAGAPVGVCWDFGHGRMSYSDQPRQLRRLGDRLKATHVHDNKGERDSHLIPFVGGNIKWEQIVPTLREIGYAGDFVLESHKFMENVPEALRPSASRLMREFGEYCLGL